ncbi:MAG: molybdopterin molybdotransferase MoeA, partial [Acidobacteria bacterium]|nr:molybdopterin molybdotransferase MoeA [Acidobacteriota bacterium]
MLAGRVLPEAEEIGIEAADGRVLAEALVADRDAPALRRSVRDGFAVRASDLPGELRVVGEIRAGDPAQGELGSGQAIEIMTGAPLPPGADAVVMVEHVTRSGDRVRIERAAGAGQFINPRGSEARAGERLLEPGRRLGFAEIALAATAGKARLRVYTRPRVAILATGDEIVPVGQAPMDHQIRNSNVYSLAAQARRAGGAPEILEVARDEHEHTRRLIERGLEADLLLLSGGVSAGKYDLVEEVLAALGAEFYFDRVLIQPGQPVVFGRAAGQFFFGLPGNPVSTMVTFEIFARAALELLGGQQSVLLPLTWSRLTRDFHHRPGLTRFLPASLSADGSELTPVEWSGSSDVPALTRGNAFLVAEAGRAEWKAGEMMRVLIR